MKQFLKILPLQTKMMGYLLWCIPLLIPIFIRNPYYLDGLVYTLLWAGLGGAWNLTGGYGGQLSLGHAAFFGIGAYTSSILFMNYHVSPWYGMIVGGLLAAGVAFVLGFATLRLRGPFFSLATMAFAEILRIMAISFPKLTQGSVGILIPFTPAFADMMWRGKTAYVYLVFVYAFGIFLLSKWIETRKFGYSLLALRENDDAALALGVNTSAMKIQAIVVSAFLTAIGGTLYAQYVLFIEPNTVFSVNTSIQFALVTIIGGMAMAGGPVLGSLVLIPLNTFLRGTLSSVNGLAGFIYGLLLIIIVVFLTDGILPYLSKTFLTLTRRKRTKEFASNG